MNTTTTPTLDVVDMLLVLIESKTNQIAWAKERNLNSISKPHYFVQMGDSLTSLLRPIKGEADKYNFTGDCLTGLALDLKTAKRTLKAVSADYPDREFSLVSIPDAAASILKESPQELAKLRTLYDQKLAEVTLSK